MGELVTLYHGTTESSLKKIMKDNCLVPTNSDTVVHTGRYHTTLGYLYLAKTIDEAFYFAWQNNDAHQHKKIVVFKITITNSVIEADTDQQLINDSGLQSYRTKEKVCKDSWEKVYLFDYSTEPVITSFFDMDKLKFTSLEKIQVKRLL